MSLSLWNNNLYWTLCYLLNLSLWYVQKLSVANFEVLLACHFWNKVQSLSYKNDCLVSQMLYSLHELPIPILDYLLIQEDQLRSCKLIIWIHSLFMGSMCIYLFEYLAILIVQLYLIVSCKMLFEVLYCLEMCIRKVMYSLLFRIYLFISL